MTTTAQNRNVEFALHMVQRPDNQVWGALSFGSEPVTTTVLFPAELLRKLADELPTQLHELADACDRENSAIITPNKPSALIVPGKGN